MKPRQMRRNRANLLMAELEDLDQQGELTAWESRFLRDIMRRAANNPAWAPSRRQADKLEEIHDTWMFDSPEVSTD